MFSFEQVDKTSKRHGGEIVAQVLQSHGIKHLFTLSGGHISPILAAAEKIGIKVVDTRHEVLPISFLPLKHFYFLVSIMNLHTIRFQQYLQLMQWPE